MATVEINDPNIPLHKYAIEHSRRRARTSYPGASYILPSDISEKQRWASLSIVTSAEELTKFEFRLDLQHRLYKVAFDGKLVLAPVTFEAGDRILDCGAGTGIWLLQMAETVSNNVILQGIDIENRLFPRDIHYPNLSFCTHSVLALPDEWKNTYKFIHQRLFIAAMKERQWAFELGELYKMLLCRALKPGGWVQHLEAGDWLAGPVNETYKNLIRRFSAARGLDWHCYKVLPQLLTDAGFKNVTIATRSTPNGKWAGEAGIISRDNLMALWRGIKVPILNNGGFGFVDSEQEMDKLLDDLEKEMDETEGAKVDWVMVYAQKPDSDAARVARDYHVIM
ncbi:hypothetical protein BDQ17DRAFT_1255519 [Cyathus striatus]|nr:hypothetical protein BDQ17DRAFT_1255519 [Cyathus striatus]